jgi:cystathionine beta-lyase/cystathionine gamma-synthase
VDKQGAEAAADRPDTTVVHAGGPLALPTNPGSSPPLFQASSYVFRDLDEVEAIYSGEQHGAIYGRYGGPNGAHLEAAIAELERAEAAVAAASGMAAICAALVTNVRPGEAVVASAEVYGGTYDLLENDLQERGIRVVYVDQTDLGDVRRALERHAPRALYLEALTNPLVHVADLAALAGLAHASGAVAVVDATFATPVLVRPLDHGVDLVVHSLGKYIGGHGDVGAGVLAGRADLVERARASIVRSGGAIAHFEAWLAMRGLRTLAIRMDRHSENARRLASCLSSADGVSAVYHPSLPQHPQHDLARRLYPRGTGGILAFDLQGGRDQVAALLRGLRRIAIVHSLGEVATTISYCAASSHRMLPAELRRALGVGDGTLRISAGIEHPDDLVDDLERALAGLSTGVRG